ncbi:MAG TPA: HEAT repeat domain-containing protein [Oculatellaceae cyanobacterium]
MALKLRAGTLLAGSLCISLAALLIYQIQPAQSTRQKNTASNTSTRISGTPPTSFKTQKQEQQSSVQPKQRVETAAGAINLDDYCANPFEPVDIASMAQRSNLIVVGRIEQVQGPKYLEIVHHLNDPNNQVTKLPLDELKSQMFYVIDVDRVIKGDQSLSGRKLKWVDPDWSQNIHVDPTHGVSCRDESKNGIPQLSYGIFFLTNENAQIRFADRDHCVLPASPTPLQVSFDPQKAVVEELVHVLVTPLEVLSAKGGAPGGESGCGARGEYSLSAGEVLMRDAVTVLAQLPAEKWKQTLSQLTTGDYPPLTKLWAFAGLLSKNDWTCFPNVESLVLNPSRELHYAASHPFEVLKDEVQTAEGLKLLPLLPNSALISSLKSTDVNIRQAVSFLLAQKKDPQLLEILASYAGTDSDETVRENCRWGLLQLSNIDPEFWLKEPALALEIASGKHSIEPFPAPMRKGAIFEQDKMTESMNARLGSNAVDPTHYPKWVTRGISWIEAENRQNGNAAGQFLQPEQAKGWSWEGSEDRQGHRLAWYTFKRRLNPASDSEDKFVVRDTTVAILIQLKNGQYPELPENGVLPSANILNVWQQDNDTIFKRQSKDTVRVLKVTRIYGPEGKLQKVSPSGIEQTASVRDVEAK